jgi:hypothetical protein
MALKVMQCNNFQIYEYLLEWTFLQILLILVVSMLHCILVPNLVVTATSQSSLSDHKTTLADVITYSLSGSKLALLLWQY